MTWREETDATARHLARLLARGGHVQREDLDAALIGRRAVLDLATTIHLDLTGLGSRTAAPTLAGLVEHPVRTFGQLLHAQPRPHPALPLTQVISTTTSDATGKLWERVAVHASLAQHHWSAALHTSHPTGDTAWSTLEHTAALVEAVTALDRTLATSAQAADRLDLAGDLHRAASSGLSAATAAVRALAATGPLPDVADLRQPPTRQVLPVRNIGDVAPALRNLRDQLLAARHISPGHVQLTAGVTARAALHAAVLTEAAAPHRGGEWARELAAALHEHGTHLATVARTPRRTETVQPGDPLPLAQATEVVRWLTAHPATSSAVTPGRNLSTAREIALATADLTHGLEQVARRHHDGAQWVIPTEQAPRSRGHTYDWGFTGPFVQQSPLVRDLTKAAEHTSTLRQSARTLTLSAARTASQGMPSTRDLTAALAEHTSTVQRPARPALAAKAQRPRLAMPAAEVSGPGR